MPFDFESYAQKCSTMSDAELQHEWEKYTRLISGAATSTTISGGMFAFTLGASGISLAFSSAAIHNARKKRDIIERTMLAHFNHKPDTRKRDVCFGLALSATVNGITMGAGDVGTSQLMAEAAQHGWVEVIAHPHVVNVLSEGAQLAVGTAMEENRNKHHDRKWLVKTLGDE